MKNVLMKLLIIILLFNLLSPEIISYAAEINQEKGAKSEEIVNEKEESASEKSLINEEDVLIEEQKSDLLDEDLELDNLKDGLMATQSLIQESETSRLGRLKNESVRIYSNLEDLSKFVTAGSTYTNAVYYIKRQADHNSDRYYLLSAEPSAIKGVIGWVKSTDLSTQTHVGIDKDAKTFHITGVGSSYEKAWGDSKDLAYSDMSQYENQVFEVNLTERIGNDIWYRGRVEEKTVWLHSSYVTDRQPTVTETVTSLLGHLRAIARVYDDYKDPNSYRSASPQFTHSVYYIKRQVNYDGDIFYLISNNPSANSGTVGWVKAEHLNVLDHKTVDSKKKTFYIKGNGSAFSKAWGGSKQAVDIKLSNYSNQKIEVNLTETVGNNTWYRGSLAGKTIWLHSSYLYEANESTTSKLGHLRAKATIYDSYLGLSNPKPANPKYTNSVYYIKREAVSAGNTYYLISTQPSASKGTLGWVKASDMTVLNHRTIDNNKKIFYISGSGSAFNRAWGGSRDKVSINLTQYKNSLFEVNLTETVGNNTWYRGVLNGKTIWVHSSSLSEGTKSSTSLLGHLRGKAVIYPNISNTSVSILANPLYTNAVYYIKQKTDIGGGLFYLISTQPSATIGTVGWVKASDINVLNHRTVNSNKHTLYLTGEGSAYSKAWGGSKDQVFDNLSKFQGSEYFVNLTETVGNNTWYRGTINGQTVWIHSSYLSETSKLYTYYDNSLNEILDIQLRASAQTDKYLSSPIWVHKDNLVVSGDTGRINGKITSSNVNIRTSPNTSSSATSVSNGTRFEYLGSVSGTTVSGSATWYKIRLNGNERYVHSSLANVSVPYYESNSLNSHQFGNITFNSTGINQTSGDWYRLDRKVTWRNAKRSDVEAYVNPIKQDTFQFIDLSESVGVSASELNTLLNGKGVLNGKGSVFIQAGKTHGVNEAYLISHALLESGNGSSDLAKGIEVGLNSSGNPTLVTSSNKGSLNNIKTVYNMYGIGARDSNPKTLGAIYAYNNNWITVDRAIIEGAAFVSNNYFARGQVTLYQMRWNPKNPGTHQYATDVGWAAKQVGRMREMYQALNDPRMILNIPRYR